MQGKIFIRTIFILAVIATNVGCDQVTKKIARDNIVQDATINLFSNHLIVTHVENSGAFLSLGNSLSQTTKKIFLSLLPALVIAAAFYYALTRKSLSGVMLLSLCFIIGGGIGNIFDRIVYESVTDFLHISFGGLQTGIFNMADVSIMVGTTVIVLYSFFKRKQNQLKKNDNLT